MKNARFIFWFWLPPLGYMAAIFFVSSLSNPQVGGETPDYMLHALEYFLLTLLLMRLFLARRSSRFLKQRQNFFLLSGCRGDVITWHHACLLAVIIAITYGVSDEIHQYFIPGRHCSWHDLVADTAGALLAYGVALLDYLFLANSRS